MAAELQHPAPARKPWPCAAARLSAEAHSLRVGPTLIGHLCGEVFRIGYTTALRPCSVAPPAILRPAAKVLTDPIASALRISGEPTNIRLLQAPLCRQTVSLLGRRALLPSIAPGSTVNDASHNWCLATHSALRNGATRESSNSGLYSIARKRRVHHIVVSHIIALREYLFEHCERVLHHCIARSDVCVIKCRV